MLEALVLVSLSVSAAQTSPQDTVKGLDRAAHRAQFHYESLLRRRAPYRIGGSFGGECDEIIGRFCFRFDSGDAPPSPPPEPAHPDIEDARLAAIRAHRRWFSAEPGSSEAAGALIRYLIEGERWSEAVAAARTHAWAAGRTPSSLMLLGLALHYAGDFEAAEAVFDTARAGVDAEERQRWDDVRVLLDPRERGRYGDLDEAGRAAYHRRFWTFSDPSLLVPGNERRSGHFARWAWVQILSEAPRVNGMVSWGGDHEEIVLRYGLPVRRERIRNPTVMWETRLRMVETFDPNSVAMVPATLATRGIPEMPPPGVRPEMERDTARSSYASVRHPRLRGVSGQVSRFPVGPGVVLRVDVALPADTLEPRAPIRPRGLLAVFDTLGNELNRATAEVHVGADSTTVVRARVAAPPGPAIYHVEVVDDSSGRAGLARYRVDLPAAVGLALSDLVVAEPFGDSLPRSPTDARLVPLTSLVLPAGRPLGLFAEVSGLAYDASPARYAVEWWVEDADPGSLLGRAFRWLGEQLGIVDERAPLRVRWDEVGGAGSAAVAFTLDMADADPGLYRLGLTVLDQVTGVERSSTRLIRIDPSAAPRRVPAPD